MYMLIGEYGHSLDTKNRLSLPSKFRKELGKLVIITRGLDQCLFVYSPTSWKKLTEKFSELSLGSVDTRGFNRFMLSGAVDIEVDSAGRVLVPDFLKKFADLKSDVVLAGVGNRVEIWDKLAWESYKRKIEADVNRIASKLAEAGAL
jgi:MraZ protein